MEVSRLAGEQVRAFIPALFFSSLFDLWKRWLACQRITSVPMLCIVFASILHVPLCYLSLNSLDMGIIGLAYATTVKDALCFLSIVIYCRCSPEIRQVMRKFDCEAFYGWGAYLSTSLPSAAMICSEFWAFEALTIMAGILGVKELAS